MVGKLKTAVGLLGQPRRLAAVVLEKLAGFSGRLSSHRRRRPEFYMSRRSRIRWRYRTRLGKEPELREPRKYSEKVQWRKLYCPQIESISRLSDKLEVMEYVRERIGADHLLPVLWVGTSISPDDVRALGDGVVIKPSHRSGQVVIVERQDEILADVVAEHFSRSLLWPYSMVGEEPWYGWQQPRIFAQPLVRSPTGSKYTQDVKFHVFAQIDGPPKIVCELINTTPHWRCTYDEHFRRMPFEWSPLDYPPPGNEPPRPVQFDDMLADARVLADGFDYVRVDFLLGADGYYFSEMTFSPVGGRPRMEPAEWDDIVGSWWHLDIGYPVKRWCWSLQAWGPLWATENPMRVVRLLHRHLEDIYLPGIKHCDYLVTENTEE